MPQITVESVKSTKFMRDFENYTLDQFPIRDTFRGIKAFTSKYIFNLSENNGLYEKDGYIAKKEYPMNQSSYSYASKKFNFLYEKYFKENDVYIAVIPDKNEFIGDLKIEGEAVRRHFEKESAFAEYLDIYPCLSIDSYYKTDTHWKQEELIPAASYLAEQMGTAIPEEYTKELAYDSFEGVYYGQFALPVKKDEIYFLHNEIIDSYKVYDYQNGKDIETYDRESLKGKDPYEAYLGGSLSLISIGNPKADNKKELIIFRDSFGSSIAPLLAQGYSRVTLVDIRYIQSAALGNFINTENADVLFLYSNLVLNNSNTLK
ncbi:MAG: hypothetical protein IKU52_00720 [Clostridia bacterium]|nr:hypothetical protein [Clostridia bacterium]